jgi:hypothetical protein
MSDNTWARIDAGSVVGEIVSLPSNLVPGRDVFSPNWTFVQITTGNPQVGWTYANGTFSAPVIPTPTVAQLLTYAQQKQATIAAGGISIGGVECSTDTASLVLLQGAATVAAANPSQTFNWVPTKGAPVVLTATQVISIFSNVSAFLQETFTALASAITGINSGNITALGQIDELAWPVNS